MLVSAPAIVRGRTRPVRTTRAASSRCKRTASAGVRLPAGLLLGWQLQLGHTVVLADDVGRRALALHADGFTRAWIEAIEVQRTVDVAPFPERTLGQPSTLVGTERIERAQTSVDAHQHDLARGGTVLRRHEDLLRLAIGQAVDARDAHEARLDGAALHVEREC